MDPTLKVEFSSLYELVNKLNTVTPEDHHKNLFVVCKIQSFAVTTTGFWAIFNFCYKHAMKSLTLGSIILINDKYKPLAWKGKIYLEFIAIIESDVESILNYILDNSESLFIRELIVVNHSLPHDYLDFLRKYRYLRKLIIMKDKDVKFIFPLDGTKLPLKLKNKNRARKLEIEISKLLTGNKSYGRKLLSHLTIHGEYDCKEDILNRNVDQIINVYLARNNLIHENCKKLLLTVLALRKFRNTDLLRLHKNVLLEILKSLWDQRFMETSWNTSLII